MKRFGFAVLLASAALAGAALAATQAVKAEMKAVVDPASNILFALGGEVDPANGPPATRIAAARWTAAADAAGQLKRIAAALQTPAQLQPGAEWIAASKELGVLAAAAETAARAKDGVKLAAAANALGDNCTACHSKYRPQAN